MGFDVTACGFLSFWFEAFMIRRIWLFAALLGLSVWTPQASAQTVCPSRLFVSGYASTVHVYDACTGAFQRTLDSRTRINGAQAIKLGPDGHIYVVSENTQKILKYHRDTLDFLGEYVTTNGNPTGIAFDSQGRLYVGRYESSAVSRYSVTGALIDEPVARNTAVLFGPDNGLTFGPDGKLYIPGYDSNNVVSYDPVTGAVAVAIPSGAQNIAGSRGLLVAKDNQHLWFTAELSGQLFKFNVASKALTLVTAALIRPTGIAYAPDGNLLVVSGGAVVKLDPATGARLGTLVPVGSGGLSLPTYIAVIGPKTTATAVEVIEYFNIGLNKYFITGRTAEQAALDGVPAAFRRTGARFTAWAAAGAPEGTEPICRFYLPPAKGGPNSHFYGRPADCDLVSATGNPVFEYEGEDFAVAIPVNGVCPSSTPFTVYRSFNNRSAQNDGNHRYTVAAARYNEMTGKGWVPEGTVFCAANAADGTE